MGHLNVSCYIMSCEGQQFNPVTGQSSSFCLFMLFFRLFCLSFSGRWVVGVVFLSSSDGWVVGWCCGVCYEDFCVMLFFSFSSFVAVLGCVLVGWGLLAMLEIGVWKSIPSVSHQRYLAARW